MPFDLRELLSAALVFSTTFPPEEDTTCLFNRGRPLLHEQRQAQYEEILRHKVYDMH